MTSAVQGNVAILLTFPTPRWVLALSHLVIGSEAIETLTLQFFNEGSPPC
jgi:hypothetical protein